MKQSRILIALLVVATILFSICALSSCQWMENLWGTEDPGTEDPGTDDPGTDDPGTDDPGTDDPGTDDPGTDDPGTDDPGTDDPGTDDPGTDGPDTPELSELSSNFYDASNWEYMTNNGGASLDGGDIPYSMADGSIKFHRANQAIEVGDLTNATVSFMLKATNDFSIWFNSSTKDNADNSSYRLAYAYGGLRIALSSAPEQAAALIDGENYNKGEWNRFDIVFSTEDGVCEIKVYINGIRAELSAGDNTTPMVKVENNVLTHTQPAMFTTGNYIVVKVWEAHNYIQLKPVAKADEKDLPIIACIGASITEGAGAGNFYTESYPAQLQNALGGLYNVVNFGNSGKTVRTDLGDDVAWLKQYQWQGVQAIVPDIAILNIGTNDSKTTNDPVSTYESFYEAYEYLIDQLLSVNPDMKIVICTVPYAYSDIWGINNDNIANIIAPVQRDIAKADEHILIDLYEYSQNKSHLFPDGVHPNTRGYEMFVKIIKKALLEGEDALNEEFINGINEEYGPKVPNAYVTVDSVVIKDMTLTITGKTNDGGLLLYVGQQPGDDTVYNSYTAITHNEDESFSVSFDLTAMPIGGWYNVRLYFTDGNYYTISLNELTDGEGGTYGLWTYVPLETTQVQICSWDEGSIPTLSFSVKEYTKPTHTISANGGYITAENERVFLTVTGHTTDPNAVILVGPSDDVSLYGHALTIADDGSFTVTVDLGELEVSTEWQNVRLVMADGNSIVVPYDLVGVNVDDVFFTANRKITVKTWGSENILSLSVSAYDSSYTLTATEVKFEGGKLVFSGTTTNVNTLTAYLYNTAETIDTYKADAVIGEDGSFTVEIDLAQLTMADGNWYYLWTSVNGGDLTKVVYENYDKSEYYGHGFRTYKWEYWEGIAVNYTSYDYGITNYSIVDVDGKPIVTLEGIMKDSTIAADTITLILDKNKGTTNKITLENLATEAGCFKFVYDASELYSSAVSTKYSEEAYFIRLYVNGTKKADVNSRWAASALFYKFDIGGSTYYLMKNGESTWYTLGLVKLHEHAAADAVRENELKATCTAVGSYDSVVYCSYCGEELSRESISVEALGHTEVIDAAVDATCTATGLTEGKHCSVCNEILIEQTATPKADHTYDDKYDADCNVCGFIRDAECAHTELTILPAKEATCTATGLTEGKVCAKCEAIITEQTVVDMLPHTEIIDAAVDATCETSGLTEGKHCSVCGAVTVAQEIVNSLGHTEVDVEALSPTCQSVGYTAGTQCSVCKKYLSGHEEVAALSSHSYVDGFCEWCGKAKLAHTVTSGSIAEQDGKIILTISGTTNDSGLKLLVGPTDDITLYGYEVNVGEDGNFTVSVELSALEISTSWQNVRFFYSDGTNAVVTYSGVGVTTNDVFYADGKKVSIKTWGNEGILSLSVEYYDSSYTLTATEVKFEGGKLVFSGTTANVRTLTAYLYNTSEGILDYKADAVIGEDGSFRVEIGLEQLSASAGNWYYLWTSVNGGDLTKVVYENYDKNEYHGYGFRTYKWEYWEGIAVNYSAFDYGITNYSISEVDGKATLTIEGIMKDSTIAANTITLLLDKTGGTKQQLTLTNLATEAGKFKFVADISELYETTVTTQYGEQAYFIRLYVNGSKKADVNSRWAAKDLFETVDIGESTYYFMRNNASSWNTLGLVRIDNSVPVPVLTPTEVKFENGKLVFSGKTENVDTLVAYLYETKEAINSYNATAVIGADGSFTVEIGLDQLSAAAGNWYFLMVSVNGGDLTKVAYEGYDKNEYHGHGLRTYKWEYSGGIAVNYSAFEYGITNYSISEVDGKATLTIEGFTKDSTIAANTIQLLLDKTKGTTEKIYVDNLATEAGKFRFVYDISGIINSANTTQYSEEAYFIRLYVNGSKKADINSRWASADLFETVDIGGGRYYLMKNGATSWNTLGLVRLDAEV